MRLAVRFQGRVQGVGFRATTRGLASGRPITGWIRNEPDGSVLLEVQGTAAEVDAFLVALRHRLGQFIHGESATTLPDRAEESAFSIAY